jgi:ABC-type multidrug transport system fused ATPase/permease subunit
MSQGIALSAHTGARSFFRYGFKIVIQEEITFVQFASFQALMVQVGITVLVVSRFVKQFVDNQSASARIYYLMERVPQIPAHPSDNQKQGELSSPAPSLKPVSMEGAIEFRNVHFTYPSRPGVPVLNGISLLIPPNSTAALVGPSGAGKSTVVALLQRFYDVTSGSIRIDDRDIRDLDLKWLRSHVGYVQQEPQLFGISVRENICYGVDRDVDQEEMESVCRKANAHDFISGWPNGYETMVGERGVQLSGGQKQRIAIARGTFFDSNCVWVVSPCGGK